MVRVSVNIVTFNSSRDIENCLDSIDRQSFRDCTIRILDNASTDDTLLKIKGTDVEVISSAVNTGFAKAHNELIRGFESEYVLVLNPDTVLRNDFIERIIQALDAQPRAGSASGKLLRFDDTTIDSTGIVMLRNHRHLDRGADQPDAGQYDRPEEIFGASGAAAVYRRSALDDVAIDGQYFDEDFFSFREDADLAWRLQLLGWTCLYVPSAVAQHRRTVTPERRSQLSKTINYHSVKNRFLLRINNATGDLYRRDFWPVICRDVVAIGYVFCWEWSSIGALVWILRHFRRLWCKRRLIQSRRRVAPGEVARWFN